MTSSEITQSEKSAVFEFSKARLAIFVLLAAIYILAWRPVRAYMTHEFVKPQVERIAEQNPDTHYLSDQQKSVTFTLFILSDTQADSQLAENWKQYVFSFPWGFYLFFPLLFFAFVAAYKPFAVFHLLFQFGTGLISIFSFILAAYYADEFIHVYRMLTYYVVPGFAFMVVFTAIFQNKLKLR